MNHPVYDLVARNLHVTLIPSGSKLHRHNGWEQDPRLSMDAVNAAAAQRSNFGVLTGEPSGAFVLDVDPKGGAMASMQAIVAEHGPLPSTLVVATPSGGWHYYWQMPGFEVRNSQSKVAAGIDIRGTGGYVVAPGSWTSHIEGKQSEGWYQIVNASPIARAPEWLREWLWAEHEKRQRGAEAGAKAASDAQYDPARADEYAAYERSAVNRELDRLRQLPRPWHEGAGWDLTTFHVACSLLEIANAGWSVLTPEEARVLLIEHAPSDGAWGDEQINEKFASARRRVGGGARPTPVLRGRGGGLDAAAEAAALGLTGAGAAPAAAAGPSSTEVVLGGNALDVSNAAEAVDWLRANLGRGPLSGIFLRGGDVVFTPRVGQEGYVEPRTGQAEDAASIVVLDHLGLSARIQARFRVFQNKEVKDPAGGPSRRFPSPALFPPAAAMHAVKAPDDMEGLRQLRGVVHAPTFRQDGTIITRPGYDEATGLLFLPTGGQPTAAIPENPTHDDVALARRWIDFMLQDFAFVSADDRANYIGLMLTPMLRSMLPSPYKLGVIEAHQPGSGKTYLARALTTIHSGVMHSELPSEETEIIKTITSILDVSTGAVVVFDNVSGVVRSSAMAGLLTSPTFQGRRLGTGKMVEATNDRLWVITGNNAALGGDLPRRALRSKLDPGIPNPERRTRFAIPDFEAWVREHRGDLLWALLVMVRHWIVVGSPMPSEVRADSYGKWAAAVGAILAASGVPGTFDEPTAMQDIDPDTEEWSAFFATVYSLHKESVWTAKGLLAQVGPMVEGWDPNPNQPIAFDLLPSSLLAERAVTAPTTLARKLGVFLRNREGRWFGEYAVRRHPGEDRNGGAFWRVVRHETA